MQVVWLKRDLRITDHRPLVEAAAAGPVLALYVAEPAYWALADTSARQWALVHDGLTELSVALKARGAQLTVRTGEIVRVLRELHAQHPIAQLLSHQETGNLWTWERDRRVAAFCREAGIPWVEHRQFGVFRGLADRDRWADLWEEAMAEPLLRAPATLTPAPGIAAGRIPSATELGLAPDPCPGRQRGGRRAGRDLLETFLNGRGARYQTDMSSPLTAYDACSRLSVHLATGTLSMREVVQAAYGRRAQLADEPWELRSIPLGAIDTFIARLHWHCRSIQKLESEPEIERRALHRFHEEARRPTAPDDPRPLAWIEGRTGLPFVDACMRALAETGWINFRMRAMLMSFASYHLDLDWAATGAALARRFADYEPGIHWPQVQMQSGATGINAPRIYNPVKQGLDHDPDGVFIRRHVPELARVPAAFIHEPWRVEETEGTGAPPGRDYPAPMVDHLEAARRARERLAAIRRRDGFRAVAQEVFARHGSRGSAPDDDDPDRTRALAAERAARAERQLKLI